MSAAAAEGGLHPEEFQSLWEMFACSAVASMQVIVKDGQMTQPSPEESAQRAAQVADRMMLEHKRRFGLDAKPSMLVAATRRKT